MKFTIVFLAILGVARPCSKIIPSDPGEIYRDSTRVFEGRVIKIEQLGIRHDAWGDHESMIFTLEVERIWKGKQAEIVMLYVIKSNNCGDDYPTSGMSHTFFTYEKIGGEDWKKVGKENSKIERPIFVYSKDDKKSNRRLEAFDAKFMKRYGPGRPVVR